jgi:hypothetical protein
MPRKRKIKKEAEDSSEPDSGEKRVKIEQKEEQSTLLSTRARDLAAAAALARLEQRNNPKTKTEQQTKTEKQTETEQETETDDDRPFRRFIEPPVQELTYPYKMMRKIEALKAQKRDTATKNVVYIVAYEHEGQWVATEFTIVGAYHGFQSANEQVMKYFRELNTAASDDLWVEASSAVPSYSDPRTQTWHIGWDGCLALYSDEGKHGTYRVYTKRLEIAG